MLQNRPIITELNPPSPSNKTNRNDPREKSTDLHRKKLIKGQKQKLESTVERELPGMKVVRIPREDKSEERPRRR